MPPEIMTHGKRSDQSILTKPVTVLPGFGERQLVCRCSGRDWKVCVKEIGTVREGSNAKVHAIVTELFCPACKLTIKVSPEGVLEKQGTVHKEAVQFFK